MQSHAFDEVLGLEEQFYDDGFRQGHEDGVKAGRIEGRTFGLEKGFEKYVESGKIYGRSLIWANRSLHYQARRPGNTVETSKKLPNLPDNPRLTKHLKVLHAVSESASLSTENSEEAVSDFDDRLKRAHAKAKIVERMVGESKGEAEVTGKDAQI